MQNWILVYNRDKLKKGPGLPAKKEKMKAPPVVSEMTSFFVISYRMPDYTHAAGLAQ
ncbi:TPA: hypothetical protein ACTYHK_004708 [Citrobacter koseri]|nr:hypothetical protein [Citrobacter koseri]HBA1504372.1 hypothetical protein [Citrobacter koseri]